mgnify:CR=1 FL=1
MLKETIKFTDFNGVERTEDHYFHLSKAEAMEMEMSTSGGLSEMRIHRQLSRSLRKSFSNLMVRRVRMDGSLSNLRNCPKLSQRRRRTLSFS